MRKREIRRSIRGNKSEKRVFLWVYIMRSCFTFLESFFVLAKKKMSWLTVVLFLFKLRARGAKLVGKVERESKQPSWTIVFVSIVMLLERESGLPPSCTWFLMMLLSFSDSSHLLLSLMSLRGRRGEEIKEEEEVRRRIRLD